MLENLRRGRQARNLTTKFRKFRISNRLPNRYFTKIDVGCPCIFETSSCGRSKFRVKTSRISQKQSSRLWTHWLCRKLDSIDDYRCLNESAHPNKFTARFRSSRRVQNKKSFVLFTVLLTSRSCFFKPCISTWASSSLASRLRIRPSRILVLSSIAVSLNKKLWYSVCVILL